MGGAVAALAKRGTGLVRSNALGFIHCPQLSAGLKSTVGIEVIGPLQVNCSRNGTSSGGADALPQILIVRARVDEGQIRVTKMRIQFVGAPMQLRPWASSEGRDLWRLHLA